MPPDLQRRQRPREAASVAKLVQRGGDQFTRSGTKPQRLDGHAIPALIRHHANYVEAVLFAICDGSGPGIVGRQALAYTIDRLRQIAEALA